MLTSRLFALFTTRSAGLGANMAMLDGAELALTLTEPSATLRDCEAAMFVRGAAAAQESADIMEILLSPAAAQRVLAMFQQV